MFNDDINAKVEEIFQHQHMEEKKVLGYMIHHANIAELACLMLEPKHFDSASNSYLFEIMKKWINSGVKHGERFSLINSITEEEWKQRATDTSLTRAKYVGNCQALGSIFFGKDEKDTDGILEGIKKQFLRRELFRQTETNFYNLLSTAKCGDLQSMVDNIVDKMENTIDQIMDQEEEDIEKIANETLHQQVSYKIPTGYCRLDECIGGFEPGQLITIGAATKVGKSSFAINCMLNMQDQGVNVALWSFEMSKREVMRRIFAIKTGFSSKSIKDKTMTEEHYNKARECIGKIKGIVLKTRKITSLGSFSLECRRLKKNKDVKVVILDYLQLIRIDGESGKNRTSELEKITNTLKQIAMELDIVIIILSQLSRAIASRNDKTPQLSDLRDSGSIEQDSDMVIFLHRPIEVAPIDPNKKPIVISIATNRDGRTGEVYLEYNGSLTKFTNVK